MLSRHLKGIITQGRKFPPGATGTNIEDAKEECQLRSSATQEIKIDFQPWVTYGVSSVI